MASESLDYRTLVQDALRSVVIRSLRVVRDQGLPGEHHFYITFATNDPEVGIADSLRQRYPEEMTVVLQHDFRDLEVDDDGFAVTMRFGGVPQRLYIPLAAVLSFYDPSVEFLLQFRTEIGAEKDAAAEEESEEPASEPGGKSLTFAKATSTRGSKDPAAFERASEDEDPQGDSSSSSAEESSGDGAGANNVVSIDAFRRK